MGTQQNQIAELTRLVKGLNGVSSGLGTDRQAQMLQALSSELTRSQRDGDEETRQTLSILTKQSSDLSRQLANSLVDKATKEATQTILRGEVGDSIAKLEFASASRQLSAKLDAIERKVDDVLGDTGAILKKIKEMEQDKQEDKKRDAEFLAERDRQDQEDRRKRMEKMRSDEEAYRKKTIEAPQSFGSIAIFGNSVLPGYGGVIPWGLKLSLTLKERSWKDAEVLVIGRPEHADPWFMDLSQFVNTSKTGSSQSINGAVYAKPGYITVCLTVFDELRKRRMSLIKMQEAEVVNGYLKSFLFTAETLFGELMSDPALNCSKKGFTQARFVLNQNIYKPDVIQ